MSDFDETLYNIGINNVEMSFDKDSNLPSNDLLLDNIEKPKNKEKEYTHDGRDKSKTSIVFKPDDTLYPKPDITGNGIDTTSEIGSNEDYKDIIKPRELSLSEKYFSKSFIGQTFDILSNIRSRFRDLLLHFTNNIPTGIDKNLVETSHIIYSNLIHSNNDDKYLDSKSKYIFRNFKNDVFFNFYNDFITTLMSLNFNNPNLKLSLKEERSLFDENIRLDNILNALGMKQVEFVSIKDIFNNWDEIKTLINNIYKIYSILDKLNIEKYTYGNQAKVKKIIKIASDDQILTLNEITKKIYLTANLLMNTITEISENICLFFKQITPNNKFEIYKDPSKIMYKIDKLNPWVSSDYHLLKELIKGADSNFEFTKKIIEMHNSVVKPNDLFLFLGDLSESELFTQNMKKAQEDLIGLCRLMHGKKIMITGNNDLCPDEFLKKCGFIEIYRDPVLLEKLCFSHGPIPCKPGIINIHGHIHGNKTYWINTYGDYIDAFYGLWGGPVKLDFLTNKKTLQSYRNGCITRLDKIYQDPETTKVPGNLI